MKSGSNLEKILTAGHFAVTSELGPPKSADPSVVRHKAKELLGYVDAANITDNQTAVVRLSSIAGAHLALDEGIEPVAQMTCRDRNRIMLQSDILGLSALGIKNLLCLTGDHQTFGNHPGSKNVFDLDSIQLVKVAKDMRDDKKFQCGEEMNFPPALYIGAVENPFADPFDYRVPRLAKKIAAGADFIQTQLVYNIEKFERWMEAVRARGLHERVKILVGIGPLKSVGAARYMKNNVAGIDIPDEVVARMTGAAKGKAKEEGIKICIEAIQRIREIKGVAGVHIMAIEWEEAVPEIVQSAGLYPRPVVADVPAAETA